MSFVKNQKIGFWAYIIVAILSLVSLVVYISNVNTAYYEDMNSSVVIMMVCAITLIAAVLVIPQFTSGKLVNTFMDIFRVVAAILIIVCGATFIGMRVESFGYIFGSNLELGNEDAYTAGNQAITGIVLFVVTWVISLIASFMGVGKKESK